MCVLQIFYFEWNIWAKKYTYILIYVFKKLPWIFCIRVCKFVAWEKTYFFPFFKLLQKITCISIWRKSLFSRNFSSLISVSGSVLAGYYRLYEVSSSGTWLSSTSFNLGTYVLKVKSFLPNDPGLTTWHPSNFSLVKWSNLSPMTTKSGNG